MACIKTRYVYVCVYTYTLNFSWLAPANIAIDVQNPPKTSKKTSKIIIVRASRSVDHFLTGVFPWVFHIYGSLHPQHPHRLLGMAMMAIVPGCRQALRPAPAVPCAGGLCAAAGASLGRWGSGVGQSRPEYFSIQCGMNIYPIEAEGSL